jgi:hypothetical protein
MDKQELTQLLQQVADGDVTPDDAALRLKMQPFQEIGAYAKVDFHRGIRQGVPEVIFGEGKAKEHILGIAREMLRSGQRTILITRLSAEAAAYLETNLPLRYDSTAGVGIIGELPQPGGKGRMAPMPVKLIIQCSRPPHQPGRSLRLCPGKTSPRPSSWSTPQSGLSKISRRFRSPSHIKQDLPQSNPFFFL